MQIAVGTYTGNGSSSRDITGVGFDPDAVILLKEATDDDGYRDTDGAVTLSNGMGGSPSALITDGFSVGSSENTNGVVFHWVAFRDNGASDFKIGSYVGDGTDNRSITGFGFKPTIVIAKVSTPRMKEAGSGDTADRTRSCHQYYGSANYIQKLEADGIEVGTSLNSNGITYKYVAWKEVANVCKSSNYTGNGTDNRDIDIGFQPDMVWVSADEYESPGSGIRTSTYSGDKTTPTYDRSGEPITNAIQAFNANGFQVGTRTFVNENTKKIIYTAWKIPSAGTEYTKELTEAVALVDSRVMQPEKVLGDVVIIADTFTMYAQKIFSEAIAIVDDLERLSGKMLSEIVAIVDSAEQIATKVLNEAISIVGSITHNISRAFSEIVNVGDVITKQIGRVVSEVIIVLDSVDLTIIYDQILTEIISIVDSVKSVAQKLLQETVTIVDSLVRSLTRLLTETISVAGGLTKKPARIMSDAISIIDSIDTLLVIQKVFSEAVTIADSFGKTMNKFLSEAVSITDSVIKTMTRIFSEMVMIADSCTKTAVRVFQETVVIADSIKNTVVQIFTEVITIADNLISVGTFQRILQEAITIADSVEKYIVKIFLETISIVDAFLRQAGKTLTQAISIADTFATKITAKIFSEIIIVGEIFTTHLKRAAGGIAVAVALATAKVSVLLRKPKKEVELKGSQEDVNL